MPLLLFLLVLGVVIVFVVVIVVECLIYDAHLVFRLNLNGSPSSNSSSSTSSAASHLGQVTIFVVSN